MCRCGLPHFSESRFASDKKCHQRNATPDSVDEEGVGVLTWHALGSEDAPNTERRGGCGWHEDNDSL
jgi:hypothetical protein